MNKNTVKKKNILIIIEGVEADKPPSSFFDQMAADKIWLLYLSPSVKAFEYKKELPTLIKRKVEIEIINQKKLVDFDYTQKALLDFIASLPERLKIGGSNLSKYLTIQGLNMWWSSGVVEATARKRNLLQNLYYLFAVRVALEKFDIDAVWFKVEDASLGRDLLLLLKNRGIKYYQGQKGYQWSALNYYLIRGKSWPIFFTAHMVYSLMFKMICPGWVRPKKIKTGQKNIHLFYSYYPYSLWLNQDLPKAKIYEDLPSALSKHLGGEDYYLCDISPLAIFSLRQLLRDAKRLWRHKFRFIPMHIYISIWEMLKIFLSPLRYGKYFRLRNVSEYRRIFEIKGINMFHTFDQCIRVSLVGNDAWVSLLHYYAFRNFTRRYGKNIFQIVYYVEFHNWEVALINGVRDGDKSVPIVGLQQSAPNPILLSFYFTPVMFKNKEDAYPLPDLILCSGELYRKFFISQGIDSRLLEVVGHIDGQYLNQPALSDELRRQKRRRINLPVERKICLVAGSIKLALTEGIIYLLKDIVNKLSEVLFVIKEHPSCPVGPLLYKYNMSGLENVRPSQDPIPLLLPLADYFLSTSTSVSQEALWQGLPQVNLDVGGLPRANPLHLLPGLIVDVQTPGQLLDFLQNSERFRPPKEKAYLFMGDPQLKPCQKFLDIVVERFHS